MYETHKKHKQSAQKKNNINFAISNLNSSDEYNTTDNNNISISDKMYESDHSKTIMPLLRSLTKNCSTTTPTVPVSPHIQQQQQLTLAQARKETDSNGVNNNNNNHHQLYNHHNIAATAPSAATATATTVSYNKISPNAIASSNAMIVNENVPLTVASLTITTTTISNNINNHNNNNSDRPNNSNNKNLNSDSGGEQKIQNQLKVDQQPQIKGRRMEGGAPGIKRPNSNNDFILSQQQHHAKTAAVNQPSVNIDNNGRMSSGGNHNINTTNIDSNLKPEKKNKGGFLSRFSGFRFSLRGKKKPSKLFDNNNAVINANNSSEPPQLRGNFINGANRNSSNGASNSDNQRNSVNKTNDFIYIPLKDPLTGKSTAAPKSIVGDGSYGIHAAPLPNQQSKDATDKFDGNHVLTTKPPLPRQPPRVVGVCAKPPSSHGAITANAQNGNRSTTAGNNNNNGQRYGHAQRSSSAPREIDVTDHHHLRSPLDDDDEDFYNQFRSDIMTSSHADNGGGDMSMYYTGGANLSTVSDKTGMNVGGGGGKVIGDDGCEYKIGLIETNLDTHETIISGKTRSLMELGPQQIGVVGQRHSSNIHHHHHHPGRNVVAVEPRRPHKSMEFLLDKENQQKVLVSTFKICFTRSVYIGI